MPREGTQLVCDGFVAALRVHGVPQEVLTDNGKVFTGKYSRPPVDVLFGVPQQVLTDMASSFTGKYAKPPVDVLFAATFTHRPAR
jgi:hypothetical protein